LENIGRAKFINQTPEALILDQGEWLAILTTMFTKSSSIFFLETKAKGIKTTE
jgi:hypothetical protein